MEQEVVEKDSKKEGEDISRNKEGMDKEHTGEAFHVRPKDQEKVQIEIRKEISQQNLSNQLILFNGHVDKGHPNRGKRTWNWRRAESEGHHKQQQKLPRNTTVNVQALRMQICEDTSHFFSAKDSRAVFPFSTSKLFGASLLHVSFGCMSFCKRTIHVTMLKYLKVFLSPCVASKVHCKKIK